MFQTRCLENGGFVFIKLTSNLHSVILGEGYES